MAQPVVRFEDRLRRQLVLQGLQAKCCVYATAAGAVGCISPAPLSDAECARLLAAWSASCTRVR